MKTSTKLLVALFVCSLVASAIAEADRVQSSTDPDWSAPIASMEARCMAMGAVVRSGNSDVDFVRLMLPHHQAAVDMAKTRLYGKDPKIRRLAQKSPTTIRNRADAASETPRKFNESNCCFSLPLSNNTGMHNRRPGRQTSGLQHDGPYGRSNVEHGFGGLIRRQQVARCYKILATLCRL
jgi:hypothetical protein